MKMTDSMHALVTGAAGDIGEAVTAALLDAGGSVTGIDVKSREEAAPRLANLERRGDIQYRRVDVSDRRAVADLVDRVEPFDVVVGNAGIVEPTPFLETDPASWQRQIDINLTGNFHLGQLSARRLVAEGREGRIIFTGSWVQDRPWPEIAAYSASKAGIRMMARTMALELAAHGIRVNLVVPGIVAAGLAREEAERNPEYAARAAAAVPLGEMQTPDDIAAAVVFLAGPGAVNITGTSLLVDGGCSLGTP